MCTRRVHGAIFTAPLVHGFGHTIFYRPFHMLCAMFVSCRATRGDAFDSLYTFCSRIQSLFVISLRVGFCERHSRCVACPIDWTIRRSMYGWNVRSNDFFPVSVGFGCSARSSRNWDDITSYADDDGSTLQPDYIYTNRMDRAAATAHGAHK